MVKELYQIKEKEISLNITNGVVDSVRKKNITKSGCRVYENGCIGVAGVLGEPTDETWSKAVNALEAQVPYPYEPSGGQVRMRTLGTMPEEGKFIAHMEKLLEILRKDYPEFIFSNKIYAREETVVLKNDLGLCLEDVQSYVTGGIIVKEAASANVFDSVIEWMDRELDFDAILKTARQVLDAHRTPIEMPKENAPVLFGSSMISSILADYLNAQKLKKGASLLSGKEGTKVFSSLLGLASSLEGDSYVPFFDAEGTTLPNDRLPLIENGVLLRGIADKKYAAEYEVELTGSAGAGYDDIPVLYGSLSVNATGTLEEVLEGKEAILVVMASGGDITPAGDFATPVQTSYLCKDGKLVGKLPEFNFRGNIFDLLGDSYLGCSSDRPFGESRLVALRGEIL